MALHRRFEVLGYALLGLAAAFSLVRLPRSEPPAETRPSEPTPVEFTPVLEPLSISADARRWVRWCEVELVLTRKCRRCHASPTTAGAPFPLLTYADTQREYPTGSDQKIADRMLRAVRYRIMPPTSLPIEPPVLPLEPHEADTLLVWLEEGALPFGTQDCKGSE